METPDKRMYITRQTYIYQYIFIIKINSLQVPKDLKI